MRKYISLLVLSLSIGLYSCEKFLEPARENTLSESQLIQDPAYAEGLLIRAYASLPSGYNFESDIASDDAVTNDQTSSYRRMAIGEWKSTFDPLETWTTSYTQIYYINKFLSLYQKVEWSQDSSLPAFNRDLRNRLYQKRLKGEAYALRAYYKWRILQNHGGLTSDNRLLGFPVVNEPLSSTGDWKLPRLSYGETVQSIFADLDTAIRNLPATWFNRTTSGSAPKVNADTNMALGARFENRMNGNTAKALKARVALFAASPSFSGSNVSWAEAASYAGPLLKTLGSLYSKGTVFYKEIRNKEIIWNTATSNTRTWEQNNFPPSLWGNGRTNPTQNLVDAFGMKNGYPINHPLSGYDPAAPYANRDPRLSDYIVYNSSTLKSKAIYTYTDAPSDGINVLLTSTRTGYYLKKFMLENVNLDPNSSTNAAHTFTFVRMTELLLNYAEAANEAWGPDGDPNGYGFTAKSLIGDLRRRGGITQPDAYLASITDADGMRALIRNERRIELCFEGFRFWDLRRWGDVSAMQAPAKAANITNNGGVYSYGYSNIEDRAYESYMIYGPVPYSETLKYNLDQNKGW